MPLLAGGPSEAYQDSRVASEPKIVTIQRVFEISLRYSKCASLNRVFSRRGFNSRTGTSHVAFYCMSDFASSAKRHGVISKSKRYGSVRSM